MVAISAWLVVSIYASLEAYATARAKMLSAKQIAGLALLVPASLAAVLRSDFWLVAIVFVAYCGYHVRTQRRGVR